MVASLVSVDTQTAVSPNVECLQDNAINAPESSSSATNTTPKDTGLLDTELANPGLFNLSEVEMDVADDHRPHNPRLISRIRRWTGYPAPRSLPQDDDEDDKLNPDDPSPSRIARHIQKLLVHLPLSDDIPPTSPHRPKHDHSGKPVFPDGLKHVKDPKLAGLLENPEIMNGEREGKQSVWSLLDAARADGGSVMLYAPFFPDKDSVVEVGEMRVLSADIETNDFLGHSSGHLHVYSATSLSSLSWPKIWPFTALGWCKDEITIPSPAPEKPLIVIWVPSKTKLSCQVMWWGYRLYLPPPVVAHLSDKSIQASKRAAIITTALTWFFSNIPVAVLPPPVQPAALLLQKLVPYVGYIGSFIAWSWGAVKGYDAGYGVHLTATWLIPVALIPGTWQKDDFPDIPLPIPDDAGKKEEGTQTREDATPSTPSAPDDSSVPTPAPSSSTPSSSNADATTDSTLASNPSAAAETEIHSEKAVSTSPHLLPVAEVASAESAIVPDSKAEQKRTKKPFWKKFV